MTRCNEVDQEITYPRRHAIMKRTNSRCIISSVSNQLIMRATAENGGQLYFLLRKFQEYNNDSRAVKHF
jgi:hypothetical protein